MMETKFCVALSQSGRVYMWPWMEDHEDSMITVIPDQDVIRISCGDRFG